VTEGVNKYVSSNLKLYDHVTIWAGVNSVT